MRNTSIITTILISLFLTAFAAAEEPNYALYGKALKANIRNGSVNYAGLKRSKDFKTFMTQLHKFDRSKLRTTNEKKSFYINLYNALTLELVLKNYPLKSLKKISGNAWKKTVYRNGQKLTLDDIEHKILRPMGDYRIHFAINCASISCPELRSEPYTAAKLQRQLAAQMKLFLADKSKGVDVGADGTARVSKIFSWFKKDFGGSAGVLRIFQKRHSAGTKIKRLKYKSYNWNLNGR